MPREAHPVVVGVGSAGELEALARELLLGAGDHRVDAVGPRAGHHGIHVAGVFGSRPFDQGATARRIALVPDGDVVVDECVELGHGATVSAPKRPVDYL